MSFIRVIPSQVLRAKFRMLDIHLGNYITLENCMDKPFLTWDSKPDTFYTLLMVDPDGPINKNIKDHCTIHWLGLLRVLLGVISRVVSLSCSE